MRHLKRETRNVTRWSVVLCATIVAAVIPVLTACAGDLALGDPRQMTFKPVEFTPPEPDCRPIEMPRSPANCSSSWSTCSADNPPPPPVRIIEPVNEARPIFSAGSSQPPVRMVAVILTKGNSWSSRR